MASILPQGEEKPLRYYQNLIFLPPQGATSAGANHGRPAGIKRRKPGIPIFRVEIISALAGLYPFAEGLAGRFTEKNAFTLNKMCIYRFHNEATTLRK